MKANELMIGDWVTFKDCQHENPMPIKIIAIGFQADEEDDCLVQINGDKACDIINGDKACDIMTIDDEIVGIPLTEEILDRNGFESVPAPSERVWMRNGQEVWLDNEGENYWANIKNGEFYFEGYIEYIHELQHALRLCGIEKEIEL